MTDLAKKYSLFIIIEMTIQSSINCPSNISVWAKEAKVTNKPTVRVTTGIQQVQGWETGLIRANPNLARWHWDPMYSYKQGYATLTPDKPKPSNIVTGVPPTGSPGRPAYQYFVPPQTDSRPRHIPFSPAAIEEVRGRLSQPIKPVLENSRHNENITGQLTNKKTAATIMTPANSLPTVATYGQLYSRKENLNTALKYGSQKTSVYGQLLNSNDKHSTAPGRTIGKKGQK